MIIKIANNRSDMVILESGTGEYVDTVHVGDTVNIIRKSQIQSKKTLDEAVRCNAGRLFVKQFPDSMERLCKRLTPNAIWLLNFLVPYIGINSGIVKFKNGRFVKTKDIINRCAETMKEKTVKRTLSELRSKGVLAKCYVQNKSAFIVNPFVMQNGSLANPTLLSLFKETEWYHEYDR